MSDLPHGKHTDHLEVIVTAHNRRALGVGATTSVFVNPMEVSNDHGTPTPGVIVSVAKSPNPGLHLFPDAVFWLPGAMRTAASEATGGSVTVQHKRVGQWAIWRVFTPAGAIDVADAIDIAWRAAP